MTRRLLILAAVLLAVFLAPRAAGWLTRLPRPDWSIR